MRKTVLTTAVHGVALLLGSATQAAVVDNFDSYIASSSLAIND